MSTPEAGQSTYTLPNGSTGALGYCRSCSAEVVFVRLASGKTPPFDLDGVSHFATCPDAPKWRKPRPRA